MAEGILEHLAGQRLIVASAGVRAGKPDPNAAEVMEEIGVDITSHKPRAIVDLKDETFDLIISLSPEAHHQALELTRRMPAAEVEYWPTFDATASADPGDHEKTLEAYRFVREQLFRRIKQRFPLTTFR